VKRCPSCLLDNQPEAVFCIRCGFSLAGVDPNAEPQQGADQAGGRYLPAGALVDGKYRIEKILGEGGMGVVYLARDVHTDTPVVVKSIRFEFADNPEFRARTLAEGRALARIDHPNVVRLNAVVVEPAGLYLVMQFIDGEPLDKMIERHIESRTAMPIAFVLSIFRMVLRGVGAAHAEGLIHRDLKPANILIRKKDGVAKVTDFGIAKVEEDAKAGRGVTKGIIGSISYMAPEQVRGQRDLDKRVDIYALGIVLYELVMGRLPFEALSDYELMRMHTETPIPRVSFQRPDAPAYLDDILGRACAKDRDHRFASTDEFLAAIDHGEGHPGLPVGGSSPPGRVATEIPPAPFVSALPPGVHVPPVIHRDVTGEGTSLPPGPTSVPRRRSPWVWYSAAALVIAGGSAAFYFSSSEDDPKRPRTTRPPLDAGHETNATTGVPEAAAPATTMLSALVGHWRSATNRDYQAVLGSDGALEFRVDEPAQHPRQGYEEGEVRFKLMLIPGSATEFAVEDRLRPTPLPGFEYDPIASRSSCVGVFSSVKGHKLLAQAEGTSSLTVDLVQIKTGAEKFKVSGKRVVGCVDLLSSPVTPVESKFSRAP
jgi:serine/threonine protein kinase